MATNNNLPATASDTHYLISSRKLKSFLPSVNSQVAALNDTAPNFNALESPPFKKLYFKKIIPKNKKVQKASNAKLDPLLAQQTAILKVNHRLCRKAAGTVDSSMVEYLSCFPKTARCQVLEYSLRVDKRPQGL